MARQTSYYKTKTVLMFWVAAALLVPLALQFQQNRGQDVYAESTTIAIVSEGGPVLREEFISSQNENARHPQDRFELATSSTGSGNEAKQKPQPHLSPTSQENIMTEMELIPLENTGKALVNEESALARFFSKSKSLFHLIHTTKEEDFGRMQKRCLESIFYHHPNAKTILHVKNMTSKPVQYLIDAGYNLTVQLYDPIDILTSLRTNKVFPAEVIRNFVKRVDGYARDPKGFWFSNESNLLRMVVMYLDGGIYLDTDTIVVKPMDTLPTHVIGFEDKRRKKLNGHVLKFEAGHAYIKACLHAFLTDFNNREWGANGPSLLTRVYFASPEQWNFQPVSPYYFQFFTWKKIVQECYEDTREHKVVHRMTAIRQKSFVVHLNNLVAGTIVDGSVCDCLYNTFCLSSGCKRMDHCRHLIEQVTEEGR